MTSPSLRLRLTLWYTLALVCVMGVFGADVLWGQGRVGVRRVDRELSGVTASVADVVAAAVRTAPASADAEADAIRTLPLPGTAVAIFDAEGRMLASHWTGPDLPAAQLESGAAGRAAWTVGTPAGPWRVHRDVRLVGSTTRVVLAAQSLAEVRRAQHEVFEAMEVAIPLMLLLAGGGGWWLATVGLRPIAEMAQRATQVPVNGDASLGHTERTDELGQFARAFDGLLDRLRQALRTQQQFMADASHELRTPVSVVRAASDVALSREHRTEAEYRETLGIVGDEARRLSRLVDHMLTLARADGGAYPLQPVDLYLDDLLAECCRTLQPVADERRVAVVRGAWPEAPVRGDEDLLRQLLLNVLQNALQHTPCGGSVRVEMEEARGCLNVRIADTGPGIAAADRERIFDRFVQVDRARRGAGSGLGLPIARWIAEAHRGSLVLESSGSSGSTFLVTLPATPAA
jgi:heavy metal sensor kinase